MNKVSIFSLILMQIFLFLGCGSEDPSDQCIYGRIVGQKCEVYALQLDSNSLGSTQWKKMNQTTGEIEATYENVIGLLDLPENFKEEGKLIYVTLRAPSGEEGNVPCYADMPGPPSPLFVVVSASESVCDKTQNN
ncbi:MAG: hypothetical protein VYB44_08350 [Bacteroidota bacterium]|uniref:hypothetical protein n=1 Tax=uncultured Roseivirga sp. TaxID=543088 RepID=UPI0025939AA0|nr:hypothetical protein [uncultured Roseivirga sp.]MEC7754026.1 hypothetical protein [Bacteroidota bacterium]